jgi:hypothetical protein
MDRRDQELLDRQLRGLNPPRNDGLIGLTVVAVFFVGIAVGGILFARHGERMRAAPNDVAAAISLVDGASPTVWQ